MSSVPPAAFNLYAYFCMRRNKDSGTCFPSQKKIAAETGINYAYVSTLKSKLVAAGWISITDEGHIRPLMGFDSAKSEFGISKDSLEIPNETAPAKPVEPLEIPKIISKIPNTPLEFPNTDFENSKVASYYSEPAQLTSPLNQEGEECASEPPPPASPKEPAPDLTGWIAAVEEITGLKRSAGMQVSDLLVRQSLALRELGFSPPEILSIAKKSRRTDFKLRYLPEDLVAARNRQANGKTNSHQRPPETAEPQFRVRKSI